ncbi:site-specific integrase [Methylocystis sp.]|uniref:tyrosine-type recombinase/integrase n=1 Tax=Methylocystis sp. TaxID=1911079 RepID=UPI0025DB0DDD|nr:site-specific integrase [Methylocystis sp.]
MPVGTISKRAVDGLKWQPPGPSQQFLWDTALRGFGVYVLASGAKAYVIQFRRDGRSQRVKIGPHGIYTPEKARDEAKRLLARVVDGADPNAEKRERRAARTVNALAEEFLAHVDQMKKPATGAEYRRIFSKHILPAIGSRRLVDVTRADIAALRSSMRQTPVLANRALAIFASMWNWTARLGHVEAVANPVKGVERFREQSRQRFLTSDEVARLGEALDRVEKNSRIDGYSVQAIKLLLLTGARLREVLHAQWAWVDFERRAIFLPDSKTGQKPLHLSAPAMAILADLPRIEGNPFIFPGMKPGSPKSGLFDSWKTIRREAGLEGVRLHDLRHSFASFGAGASLGLPVIGKLLGHTQASTTQRYAHLSDDPLYRAVDAIGATISAALDGKTGGDIAPLKKPRGNAK